MGCSISLFGGGSKVLDDNRLTSEEAALVAQRAPKVYIRAGSDVPKYDERGMSIIYIFGGPGSMKGILTEDLVTTYGFQVISGEEIILNYLPNRVANTVTSTQEIQELIKEDPGLLQLDWVLNLIGAKLATTVHRLFIIDLVPNLTAFLKVDHFIKQDVRYEMNGFQKRHPAMFALNLSVPEDKVVESTPGILMPRANSSSSNDKEEKDSDPPKKDADEPQGTSAPDATPQKEFDGTDEADQSRFQRRYQAYTRSVGPFIQFFADINRLVTVDVVPKQRDHVWKRLNEFFREQGFGTYSAANTVVLFVFDSSDVDGLDPVYYKMLKVSLSSLLSDEESEIEFNVAMRAVRRYIHTTAPGTNHLILLDCLQLNTQASPERRLAFMEIKECYLDTYIKVKSSVITSRPYKRPFKAISLTNNEVFIFPADTNSDLCCRIALAIVQRPNSRTSIAGRPKTTLSAKSASIKEG